ncbi:alkyl sulfatase dimerization domain-containing protein [Vibrio sp. WXL103]|uniref:alkyl sulfatase dimerization domain-containing protein n=1 Tax=Vibrio sp. WXL103 TaxID=3450710 RepID=UPI003EC80A37
MKKTLLASLMGIISFGATAAPLDTIEYLNATSPYYDGQRATKVAPNGALISDEMHQEIVNGDKVLGYYTPNQMTHEKVAPGVHSFNAGGIINVHYVETDNGIVIYDAGDDLHDGEMFYNAFREQTDKPIVAMIYSHEHYVGGAQLFVDEEAKRGNTDIMIIGHYNHNASVRASAVGVALHKEASDVLLPRTLNQFYSFIEPEGPQSIGYTHDIDVTKPKGLVDVNTPITENGQEITIDGRKFVFYVDGIGTDSANNVTAHIPDQGIVMNNAVWGWYPNLYSIRGGAYRNPQGWVDALELVESLEPNILLNTHSKSVNGAEASMELIHTFKDGITSVLNQTLLQMVKGETRSVAAHNVKLPEVIVEHPNLRQNYGEIVTMVPQIYSAVIGSFNGEVADAVPMHPEAEADMIIRAIGGQEKALEFAKGEMAKGNFHYALKMGKHLVNYDASHQPSIDFKVDAMYAMAESTMSHNLRSWYLTQARILKGEVALPGSLPAMPEAVAADVTNYVDNYRIRLNHEKAGNTAAKIGFQFDNGDAMALKIRNGVSYSSENIDDADVVVRMGEAMFTKLYNNLSTIGLMVQAGEASIVSGSVEQADELMSMFDIVYDWQNDEGLKFLISLLNG